MNYDKDIDPPDRTALFFKYLPGMAYRDINPRWGQVIDLQDNRRTVGQ
ncbi:MAG: hypothetical protein MZV63_31620 [Marinilabiliales bacterium]|nr:hypothetical protein [Marinilabiliales bacterium]